jgi:hypothetical protein
MHLLRLLAILGALSAQPATAADNAVFEVTSIPTAGRVLTAELADVNGDGRTDLFEVTATGVPPAEQRLIRVFLQSSDEGIPPQPTFETALPPGAAAYDTADLRATPGTELVLLQAGAVTVLSLAAPDAPRWVWPITGDTTLGPTIDERGLERFRMAWPALGTPPVLVVPTFGGLVVLSPDGQQIGAPRALGRSNYFIPRRMGLYFGESDLQLFFDAARVSVADVNGDGHADITSATRHEVRVFLRRPDGGFDQEPDRTVALGLVQEKDHIRGSGGVSADVRDVNGDGRADILLSVVGGGFTNSRARTTLHLNRGGTWNLATPDSTFVSEASIGGDTLVDLDRDGKPELVQASIPFSVLELVEALVTRSVDVRVTFHVVDSQGAFAEKPVTSLKLSIPLSFETFRTKGFLPTLHGDVNGDGYVDLLTSGDGNRIEVRLGGLGHPYSRRVRQRFDTRGQLRFGDVDSDGLTQGRIATRCAVPFASDPLCRADDPACTKQADDRDLGARLAHDHRQPAVLDGRVRRYQDRRLTRRVRRRGRHNGPPDLLHPARDPHHGHGWHDRPGGPGMGRR